MTLHGCPRENDLRARLARGIAADPDLRAHAAGCRACGDLLLVTEAFHDAHTASAATARLSPPGVLWWRAQLRRRQAALEQVTRRLLGAQILALALTLAGGFFFLAYQDKGSQSWATWLAQLPKNAALHWDDLLALFTASPAWSWMILGPALLLLTGVAVYVATDRQ